MTSKWGVFSEVQAVGDPYIDKLKPDQSTRGLPNVRVGTCKSGKVLLLLGQARVGRMRGMS